MAFSEDYDVTVMVHQETSPDTETQGAVLVSENGDKDDAVWVPKSQITGKQKTGRPGVWVITLPEWLAAEKGFT